LQDKVVNFPVIFAARRPLASWIAHQAELAMSIAPSMTHSHWSWSALILARRTCFCRY